MGFQNPNWSWAELEAALSGRAEQPLGRDGRALGSPSWNAGGDGPAWTRHRQPFDPAGITRRRGSVPYAELHCHSLYSFGDGASHPEELVREAAELGLEALALTDHNGFYGIVRFAEAAKDVHLPTIFGTEITLTPGLDPTARVARSREDTTTQVATGRVPDSHAPDPHGSHLLLLADGPDGYARISRALSLGHLAGEKGAPQFTLADVADTVAGHAWVLTGCRKGSVPAALVAEGPSAARRELQRLIAAFGRDRVLVELWDHGDPLDLPRNDALAELAAGEDVGVVATNNVHYATPTDRQLANALAAVRSRRSLDDLTGWLPPAATAHLRSGAEQARRFRRYPGAVELAAEIGRDAAFDIQLVAPGLPPFACPDGLDEMAFLRRLVEERAPGRFVAVGSKTDYLQRVRATLERELALIEEMNFPGYFLVVWDLVRFCRERDILCQGRGSAANSAVCYALGVTNADPIAFDLLFERFLSVQRGEPPDIDIDIESGRREEVIQYVYDKHGRWHTAQVANVITYRARSAVRDMAKALGHSPGQQDAWSKRIDGWGTVGSTAAEEGHGIPPAVLDLARQVEDAPRHLGIHSGGMVICDRPIIEVCPVEWARMENRSVLQWDKDDCERINLVKFDLLGLGMLSALHGAFDLIAQHRGRKLSIADLPPDDEQVFEMICRADTVGVFQIESRAQMATLPRLRPRDFQGLVAEVALIRPGPIQGGSVHPYIRRRNGQEPETYLHDSMKRALKKTYGVPLFQEQLMQLAIDVAGFDAGEADELRRAMGSKRSMARMEALRQRFYAGMAERGIEGEIADEIFTKMKAFANYGFPESHAISFAHLVYASSWIKYHEPAAFCAALVNAQPMGFWSAHTLCQDARRHGVVVRTPDLNVSAAATTLEPDEASTGGLAVRLGLASVRKLGKQLATQIHEERLAHGDYRDMEDLVRRVPTLELPHLEMLATAGAFGCFGLGRREALWAAGAAVQARLDRIPGITSGIVAPRLPGMEPVEEAVADLWATGIAPNGHPTRFVREQLRAKGVVTAEQLGGVRPGARAVVAGVVTHRQRPMTAQGTTFLSLEDETGLINVVVSKGCWTRYRRIAREAAGLVVRGRIERSEGVVNVVAEQLYALTLPASTIHTSRDFR